MSGVRPKRRSWFQDQQQPLHFDVTVEKETKSKAPKSPTEGDIEILTLTHFTKPPRIDFDTVRINNVRSRHLRVINPHDFPQDVIIEKFPTKKNFSIDLLEFTVEAGEEIILTMTWSPTEAGNVREMIQFQVDNTFRLTAILFGKCEEPPKLKKRKGLTKRPPVLDCKENIKPRKVLQSKENIKKSHSRDSDEQQSQLQPLRIPSPSKKSLSVGVSKPMPCITVVDSTQVECTRPTKHEISHLVEQLPEPGTDENIIYRDSLEDPDDVPVLVPTGFDCNTFIAGRASVAPSNIRRPIIPDSTSLESTYLKPAESMPPPPNPTKKSNNICGINSENMQPVDSSKSKKGNTTYVNAFSSTYKVERENIATLDPVMNSTCASSMHRSDCHTDLYENTNTKKFDWKKLGHLNTLTPIDKRQSRMHVFEDLGESMIEEIIVKDTVVETIEEDIVERIEEDIIETVTTETWIDDGKGGKMLISSKQTSDTVGHNVTENVKKNIYCDVWSKNPDSEVLYEKDGSSKMAWQDKFSYEKVNFEEADPALDQLPDTPSRRMTYKKELLPSKCVNLIKNDPALCELPDTPTRRMTFKKDDPEFPETPTKRMTFIKNDPSMPVTPVRRDTFLKRRSVMSNTPVIEVDSPEDTNVRSSAFSERFLNVDECDTPNTLRRACTYTKLNLTPSPRAHKLQFLQRSPTIQEEAVDRSMKLDDLTPTAQNQRSDLMDTIPIGKTECDSPEDREDFNTPQQTPLQGQRSFFPQSADSAKSSEQGEGLNLSDLVSTNTSLQDIKGSSRDSDSPEPIDNNSYTMEDSILSVDLLPVIDDIEDSKLVKGDHDDSLQNLLNEFVNDSHKPALSRNQLEIFSNAEDFEEHHLPKTYDESLTEARNILARESLINPQIDDSLVEIRKMLALENHKLTEDSLHEAQQILCDVREKSGLSESLLEVSNLLTNASESFCSSPFILKSPKYKQKAHENTSSITDMVQRFEDDNPSFKSAAEFEQKHDEELNMAPIDQTIQSINSKSNNRSHFHVTFSEDTKGGLEDDFYKEKQDTCVESKNLEEFKLLNVNEDKFDHNEDNKAHSDIESGSVLKESFSNKEVEEMLDTVKEEFQSRLSSTPVAVAPQIPPMEEFGITAIKNAPSPIIGRRVSQLTITKSKPDLETFEDDGDQSQRLSRKELFTQEGNLDVNSRRFSTLTVTKSKPDVLDVSPEKIVIKTSSRQLFSDRDQSQSPNDSDDSSSGSVKPVKGRIIPTRFAAHISPMGRGTPTRPHLSPMGRHLSPTSPVKLERAASLESAPTCSAPTSRSRSSDYIVFPQSQETPSAFVVQQSKVTSNLIKKTQPAAKKLPVKLKAPNRPSIRTDIEEKQKNEKSSSKVDTGKVNIVKTDGKDTTKKSHHRSLSGNKRPHSVERKKSSGLQSSLSSVSVKKPKTSLPQGAGVDQKLTKTLALRRQAALNSMSKNSSGIVANRNRNFSGNSSGTVKGVAKSKLVLIKKATHSALAKQPLPFASKNMYYDERWMEKQERGFVKWLNFILTPPEDVPANPSTQKVDAGKLLMDAQRGDFKVAPTKETLSFRSYSAKRRMNRLRRNACLLFQCDEMVKVHEKLEREVTCERLLIRRDRKVHADLGLKQTVLNMLLSYNPLWLRIALETVYGELIPVQNNLDIMGLSRFIATRLLNNPEICSEFAHPTVPHLYRDGFSKAMNQYMLKKFLLVVLFLDKAKQSRLIDHDPCLFCKDSPFKSNRDLLLAFSRELLAGEGDINKHLGYMGYTVSHVQTARDEYDYAVTNLATDVRDGVRLTRALEMLTQEWNLSQNLRVPAISRLQKIHNVGVAFKCLLLHDVSLDTARGGKIDARDVADGHREKTLQLLWKLIFSFQVVTLVPQIQLEEEVSFLKENLALTSQLTALLSDQYLDGEQTDRRESVGGPENDQVTAPALKLLLQWCRAVCAYYDMKIENFTVSFSDGRAICYILHHYHPSILPLERINTETTLTYEGDKDEVANASFNSEDSFSENWTQTISSGAEGKAAILEKLLSNEKENFRLLADAVSEIGGVPLMLRSTDMSGTIPDEKVTITYLTYLCARILDIRLETRAARIIQAWWRRIFIGKHKKRNKTRHQAAAVIQSWIRPILQRRCLDRRNAAALVFQRYWRGRQGRELAHARRAQKEQARQERAAVTIQAVVRSWLLRHKLMHQHKQATVIQAQWRSYRERQQYLLLRSTVCKIQTRYRANVLAHNHRQWFLYFKQAAITIQAHFRGFLARKLLQKHQMARVIQSVVRGHQARAKYHHQRCAAITIQANLRMALERRRFVKLKSAAVIIQSRFRAMVLARRQQYEYYRLWWAAITLQAAWRGKMARHQVARIKAATKIQTVTRRWLLQKQLDRKNKAATIIQRRWKATQIMKQHKIRYHLIRGATLVLQEWAATLKQRKNFLRQRQAVRRIQQTWAAYKLRQRFLLMQKASTVIQEWWRGVLRGKQVRYEITKKKAAALILQTCYRTYVARKSYLMARRSIIRAQSVVRCYTCRVQFIRLKAAALVVQDRWRAVLAGRKERNDFLKKKQAVTIIQSVYRGYCTKRKYQQDIANIVKVQSFVRMHQTRKTYMRKKAATEILQNRWRAKLTAKAERYRFLAQKNSVVLIQSCYRSYLARKEYKEDYKKVVRVQNIIKMHQARRRFLLLKNATLIVQYRYRAKLEARKQHQEYVKTRQAAIRIQSWYRGTCVKVEYKNMLNKITSVQSFVRMFLARRRYLKKKTAAIIIQYRLRAMLVTKLEAKKYIKMRNAAITIQKHMRSYMAQKAFMKEKECVIKVQSAIKMHQVRMRFLRLKAASLIIQRRYRAIMLTRIALHDYTKKRDAALMIQRMFRGYRLRKQYKEVQEKVILIQAYIRRYQAKKRYHDLKMVTITVQRYWKATLCMKKEREQYLRKRQAILLIQAHFRSWHARKVFKQYRENVIRVQSLVRGHKVLLAYRRQKCACAVIQNRWRATLLAKKHQESFYQMKKAATIIQAYYRGLQARRGYLLKRNSIIKIQNLVRAKQATSRYIQLKSAAIMIQRKWRATLLARHYQQQYHAILGATIIIQSRLRGQIKRQQYLRQIEAAIKIQSSIRCFNQRQKYLRLLWAAAVIKKHWFNRQLGRQQQHEYQIVKQTTIHMQAVWRGTQMRKKYLKFRSLVIKAQSVIKCCIVRKRYLKQQHAASVIQQRWRATMSMRREHCQYLCTQRAATKIQSAFRGYIERKYYEKTKARIIKIQSLVRMKQIRRQYLRILSATVTLQKYWKATLAMRKDQRDFLHMQGSARIIQSTFRGFIERQKYQNIRKSIIVMQSIVRMHIARTMYIRTKAAIIVIQRKWRTVLDQRRRQNEHLSLNKAAVCIQRFYRGYQARRQYVRTVKNIVKLQSYVKMQQERMRFLKLKKATLFMQTKRRALVVGRRIAVEYSAQKSAVTCIQSYWRGHMTRKVYAQKMHSIVMIQKLMKMYLVRKKYLRTMNAITLVQSYWRATVQSRHQRAIFLHQKYAAIKIQSMWKMYRCKKSYTSLHGSVIKIQSLVKMQQARIQFVRKLHAIQKIQQWWRACKSREQCQQEYIAMKAAAIKLQSCWKCVKSRREYEKTKHAAVKIQACVKCYQQRKQYVNLRNACVIIQAKWRAILLQRCVQKMFQQQKRCTVVIQAFWRGWKSRKEVQRKVERVVKVQTVVRMFLARRKMQILREEKQQMILKEQQEKRNEYLNQFATVVKRHLAVIRLQRKFRQYIFLKESAEKIQKIICLQRWFRVKLQKLRYLRWCIALRRFQCAAREYIAKRHAAATKIQSAARVWFARREVESMHIAATIIQAVWRGSVVRRAVKDYKIHEARRRISEAQRNATDDKRLCNRTSSALDKLLSYKQLALVLEAVMNLDTSTRLSPSCCERMVNNNAVPVIFKLMKGCNRSLPHMEIVKHSVNILLNLAKYEKTVSFVYECPESIDILIEIMTIHREKGIAIFTKCCILMAIFCYNPDRAKAMGSSKKVMDKLTSFQRLAQRKRDLVKNRLAAAKNCNASLLLQNTPAKAKPKICPEWVLHRNKMREITDPHQAINYLMSKLGK